MKDICGGTQKLGKAIASPTRYQIVETLLGGAMSVSDIVRKVKLTQPAISQHLHTLKRCGIVTSSKKGQEVYYSLNVRHILNILCGFTSQVKKCKQNQ